MEKLQNTKLERFSKYLSDFKASQLATTKDKTPFNKLL